MSFTIFSFYTISTPYSREIQNLQKDCKNLSIPFMKVGTQPTGKWVENTMLKPSLILKAMDKCKTEVLVWVDADARIKSYPTFFDELEKEKIDFSVFQMGSQSRITSGTIFMRVCPKIRTLLEAWAWMCKTSKERLGDQHELRKVIKRGAYKQIGLKYKALPYSYCFIFDDSLRNLSPSISPLEGDPVILHTQASRRYKGKML